MISFTPHLIPQKRGILSTIYANPEKPALPRKSLRSTKKFYENEFLVMCKNAGELPETKHVAGSNFVDIGVVVDKRLQRAVVVSAIDNLVKGAAGQAIQNMNLMFGGLTKPQV